MSKSPLKSKTVLFNILTLLSVSIVAVADHQIIEQNPVAAAAVAVAASLINVALRLVTKTAIK